MVYATRFIGSFQLSRPLTQEESAFLIAFRNSRRMKYDVAKLQEAFGGAHGHPAFPTHPYGSEGSFFTETLPDNHPAIVDYNEAPLRQPGLRCLWQPVTATTIGCPEGWQQFAHFVEWLEYLVEYVFRPFGIQVNGAVQWTGEDPTDCGVLSVRNNQIHIHYEDEQGYESEESD